MAVNQTNTYVNECSMRYRMTEPAARRFPSHGAKAATRNGSPPALTTGVRKFSAPAEIVTA